MHSDDAMGSARAKAKYAGIDYGHGSPRHMEAKGAYEKMVSENAESRRASFAAGAWTPEQTQAEDDRLYNQEREHRQDQRYREWND